MKIFGSLTSVTFSPVVTIEPRRRKFHRAISLKIPLPAGFTDDQANNLRLLCSTADGTNKSRWQDMTGATPLSIVDDCILLETSISMRFWLVHCLARRDCDSSPQFADAVYERLIQVPYYARFIVYAKRLDLAAASVRVFCVLDDSFPGSGTSNATSRSKSASSLSLHTGNAERKALEALEHYTQVARSRDVRVVDGQHLFVEFGGNLALLSASAHDEQHAEQPTLVFKPFIENSVAFTTLVRDVSREPFGKIAFMADSVRYLASLNAAQRAFLSRERKRAVCTLGVSLPPLAITLDAMFGSANDAARLASAQICDESPLTIADVARELRKHSLQGSRSLQAQTMRTLASKLGVPADELAFIQARESAEPELVLLMHWYQLSASFEELRGEDLARALFAINRRDIASKLGFDELPASSRQKSTSVYELLREIDEVPATTVDHRSTDNLSSKHALDDPNACYHFGKRNFATSALRASTSSLASSNARHLQQRQQQQLQQEQSQRRRSRSQAPSKQSSSGVPKISIGLFDVDETQTKIKPQQVNDDDDGDEKDDVVVVDGSKQRTHMQIENDDDDELQQRRRQRSPSPQVDARDLLADIDELSSRADRIDKLIESRANNFEVQLNDNNDDDEHCIEEQEVD